MTSQHAYMWCIANMASIIHVWYNQCSYNSIDEADSVHVGREQQLLYALNQGRLNNRCVAGSLS